MYHIKQDKRAEKSAQLIGQGVLELLAGRRIEDISISEIERKTGITRATFYRSFDRVEDVPEYLCDIMFDEIQEKILNNHCTSRQELIVDFISAWMEKKTLIMSLAGSGNLYLLCNAHTKKLSLVKQMLRTDMNVSEKELDYVCYLLAYIMPMAMDIWVAHGQKESARELYAHMRRAYHLLGQMMLS